MSKENLPVCYEFEFQCATENWDFIRKYEFGCCRQQFQNYLNHPDEGIVFLAKACLRELDILFNYLMLSRPIFGDRQEVSVRQLKPIFKKLNQLERFFRDAMGLRGHCVLDAWHDY